MHLRLRSLYKRIYLNYQDYSWKIKKLSEYLVWKACNNIQFEKQTTTEHKTQESAGFHHLAAPCSNLSLFISIPWLVFKIKREKPGRTDF